MLGTVRKGEQAGVAHSPCIERIAGFSDEPLADATVPDVGPDGDRPEEAHAAPACREVRSDELSVVLGRKCLDVLCAETTSGIVEVAPEFLWIGCAQERPEGDTYDALCFWHVALFKRTNDGYCALPAAMRGILPDFLLGTATWRGA